ncbi:flagellar hook-length control protein FliK [Alteromonas sp. A081]|uniref:flagellar hook-length control protein FliK n=1 Tax=Alteromonas sp. A081 TaxID=3410269 RepID=UPI003B9880C7
MQQVAANKTDIAALPFSETSAAKAVGTGLNSHANGQNSEAFNSLYQEAKTTGRDFLSDEKARNADSASRESETRAERAELNSEKASAKSRENAHKDSMLRDSDRRGLDFDKENAPKNASLTITEKEYTIGAEGDKALTDKQIINGGLSDAKPTREEAGEPDWIALVEGITKSALGQASNSSRTQGSSAEGIGNASNSTQAIDAKGLDDSNAVTDSVAEVISHLQSVGGKDAASSQTLADKLSALAHLLNKQIESAESKDTAENKVMAESGSTDKLSTLLAALTEAESSEEQQGANLGDANSENAKSEESAQKAFLLSLVNDALPTATNDRLSKALSIENAGETATVQTDTNIDKLHEALTDSDEKSQDLVTFQALSALNAENAEAAVSDTHVSDVVREQSRLAAQQEAASKIGTSSAAASGENALFSSEAISVQDESLLMAISKLSAESAQKATEAFAERMVALVPNSQQQQAVKTNIIAGINEFQKQVEQGHQPGIDLSAIVSDAAKEASLASDVSAALNSRVDAQAGQFMQLMNNAQNSIHQIVQNQFAHVDTAFNENSQLRSEASKPQQQFEGFDKAVNIQKPEGQQQLNEKIRWMVNARNTMAEIRLDPPELGSMQVRVNVQGDAASVSFIVQSQQAKDALADSMGKLRDMLSEQGIELGDAQVRKDNSQSGESGESGQQLAGQNGNGEGQRGNNGAEFDDDTRVIEQAVTREAKGGIDYYA